MRHVLETFLRFNSDGIVMDSAYLILLSSAVTLGILHTAVGIDHSLPFVVLAKARGWALGKTLGVTGLCGVLHVFSSVVIAAVGLSLGVAAGRIELIESMRGGAAAWLLVTLGTIYTAVAVWKRRAHGALPHARGHAHGSTDRWRAISEQADRVSMPAQRLMPALFVIFALGPCEALLPLLTASGLALSLWQSCVVALIFSLATVGTMLVLVSVGLVGTTLLSDRLPGLGALEPHAHTLAGLSLIVSGLAIQVLGI